MNSKHSKIWPCALVDRKEREKQKEKEAAHAGGAAKYKELKNLANMAQGSTDYDKEKQETLELARIK